jgi:hypothetical protein
VRLHDTRASRIAGWLLYAGAWALAAVFYAAILVAQRYTTFAQGLASGTVYMATVGAAGVGIWRLSGSARLRRLPLPMSAALHAALALLLGAACVASNALWLYLSAGGELVRLVMAEGGVWMGIQGAGLYALVLGLSHVVRLRRRLRDQQLAAARAEAAAARAELHALRAQLNPHFLFNALHSLASLVRYAPAEAEEAIEQLGTLLRYALDRGGEESVRLEEEWAFCRTYLALEERRLGERLCVRHELSAGALGCLVPPFCMQLLAENAVKHGLSRRPGGGTVTITAHVHDARLHLDVCDDGDGADSEAVARSSGTGLRTLREQLHDRYGERAALAIETAAGAGFRVRVVLPAVAQVRPGARAVIRGLQGVRA